MKYDQLPKRSYLSHYITIFLLHGMLSCSITKASSNVYLAFIDLRKAFDKQTYNIIYRLVIHRDIIFQNLCILGLAASLW